ncbi:hypothetical protein C0J52_00224 [Blattella germanica]|nr:hypothetical protein C0J52_00224 [Blattella germanica]
MLHHSNLLNATCVVFKKEKNQNSAVVGQMNESIVHNALHTNRQLEQIPPYSNFPPVAIHLQRVKTRDKMK